MTAITKRRLKDVLDETAELYEVTMTPAKLRAYWEDLQGLPEDALRACIRAHRRDPDRGRWFPLIADILARADSLAVGGWPGPEEAWGIAVRASDESETVVWTQEIAEAWGVAREIFAAGDRIGARMAFREAYQRLVERARMSGAQPEWTVSLGDDKARQADAIRDAAAAGLISHDRAQRLLPTQEPTASGMAIAGLLTGAAVDQDHEEVKRISRNLSQIRELLRSTDGAADRLRKRREAELERRAVTGEEESEA